MGIELNKFYICESVNFMKENIPDDFVDLTVTSPPYDDLRKYKGYIFDYKLIFKELYRVTKIGGVVVWIVSDATIKGSETGTSFKHALYAKEIGFNLHDTMIWNKISYPPNDSRQNRYPNSFEYMFIFSKGKPKVCNYIKTETKYGGKVRTGKQRKQNGERRDDYANKSIVKNEKPISNVWLLDRFCRKSYPHPAPFPEQLANDHIITWSNEGDIILDPMCGSGTVAKMAFLNKRNFIGIDISEEYINEICIPRLEMCGWKNENNI